MDAFLPPFAPRQVLDPGDPVSIGAMVGPEAFTEVRYLAHLRNLEALERIPALAKEYGALAGREVFGLVTPYRMVDADIAVVALGSVLGTLADAVDSVRADGIRAGVLGITAYRPFPFEQVRQALRKARRVVVLERAFAVGVGGIVSADVYSAIRTPLWTVVAGLGGRPVTAGSLRGMLHDAATNRLKPLTSLDLDHDRVRRELRAVGGAR